MLPCVIPAFMLPGVIPCSWAHSPGGERDVHNGEQRGVPRCERILHNGENSVHQGPRAVVRERDVHNVDNTAQCGVCTLLTVMLTTPSPGPCSGTFLIFL